MRYLTAENLSSLKTIRHAFFTREGGVSAGLYASLNCGPGSGDVPVHVAENRARAAQAMGAPAENLCSLYQVHGVRVITVDCPWPQDQKPEADAMVTNKPGLVLGILTADCAPVLFADETAGVIGAAHAGWKGAIGGVAQATIAMMEKLGARRERIAASVGPCIQQVSYEVDAGFERRFLERDVENKKFFKNSAKAGHHQFDLSGYIIDTLRKSGVLNAHALPNDTCAEEASFFSYRRKTLRGESDYARQISAIVLRG